MLAKFTQQIRITCTVTLLLALTGCAVVPKKNPQDPYERYNRPIFDFNLAVDRAFVRPVAKTYNKVVPQKVQARVTNFFNNVDAVPTIANDILQLNGRQTIHDSTRFVYNSTIGILGLFDPATKIGLSRHHNDFGLTLARWGMKKSPYLVLPLFGPSTVRDSLGMPVDYYLSLWPYVDSDAVRYSLYGLNKLNQRVALLPTDKLVDEAFDPYVFVRDAYLQKRQSEINGLKSYKLTAEKETSDTYVAADENEKEGDVNLPPPSQSNGADPYVPPDGDSTNNDAEFNNNSSANKSDNKTTSEKNHKKNHKKKNSDEKNSAASDTEKNADKTSGVKSSETKIANSQKNNEPKKDKKENQNSKTSSETSDLVPTQMQVN